MPEAQECQGRAIVNLLELENDEKITACIPLDEDATKGNLIMATKNGLIKKTALEEFAKIRRDGKIAIKLVDDDELISVQFTNGKDQILVASAQGKCIRFSEKEVRLIGRDTQGVKSIDLDKGDYVVDMTVIKPGYEILTVSQYGYGKRADIEIQAAIARRQGIKAGVFNENRKAGQPKTSLARRRYNAYLQQRYNDTHALPRHIQDKPRYPRRKAYEMDNGGEVVCVAVKRGRRLEVF